MIYYTFICLLLCSQLCVALTETGKGKLSEKACFKQCESMKHSHDAQTMIYKIKIHVDSHFGTPRAFVIQNQHKKKFFLQSASSEITKRNLKKNGMMFVEHE